MNVQVGGGPAATAINVKNNISCVDLCASVFAEIPDRCMCTALKRASDNIYKICTDLKKCIDNDNIFSCQTPHFWGVGGGLVVEKKY